VPVFIKPLQYLSHIAANAANVASNPSKISGGFDKVTANAIKISGILSK